MITAAEREQLLRKAQIVANETETAANDANRIGTLFALIVRALGDGATEEDIKDLIRNTSYCFFTGFQGIFILFIRWCIVKGIMKKIISVFHHRVRM